MLCLYPRPNGQSCGQCANCLINKSMAWKFRLNMELLYSDLAFWLTLQYADEFLYMVDSAGTGDFKPAVCKKHCINYFHKVRKHINEMLLPVTMKYFLKSEYGPRTNRPHYHVLILFRFTDDSFSLHDKMYWRQVLYDLLKERWYHGHVEEKLMHSGVIGYLSKYVFKDSSDYEKPISEFALISKGIGIDYLSTLNKKQVISNNFITADGFLPRYYRDKLLPRYSSGLKYTTLYYNRKEVVDRVGDMLVDKQLKRIARFKSLVDFYKNQELLRNSQRLTVERKQLKKYG